MKTNALLWIVKQIKNRLPAIAVMTAAQVGHALFCVCFALGSRNVIDSAVAGNRELFHSACLKQFVIIAGIIFCMTLVRHLRDRLHADLERDWKQRLLHGLLHGDYAAVSSYHSAELLNRLNNDVAKVNEGILTIVPSAASMATRLIAAIAVLGILDTGFTMLVVVAGTIVIVVTAVLRRRLKDLNKSVSEHDGKVSGYLQETVEKLLVIQAMDVAQEVERRADLLLEDRYRIQRKRKNVSLLANTSVSLMHYGAGFLALCWSALRLLRGQMSFGSLTAVIQLVNQLQAPFVNLSGVMPQYVAMIASAERLMELDRIRGEKQSDETDYRQLYERMDALCADNLCFSYDRDEVLRKASFSLPKNAFAVVTGSSGIGKSTILKLLLGVFRPDSGEIYLDCHGQKVPLDRSKRGLFAYVPQGNLLFSGSLLDNLTIVKPDATQREIEQAVYISCMDEFMDTLPDGLDTVLGESGAGLSEGQGQRLAIARAVLGGAPILLLDECTSALDEDTERKVLQRLRSLPNRICIAVTHRSAAVSLCDWQMEMKDGAIAVRRADG